MNSVELAREIRKSSVGMVYRAHSSHIGSALSMTDILAVLYADILRYDAKNPKDPDRDRFLLSKGHACVAFYSVLALCGFYPVKDLEKFAAEGSVFLTDTSYQVPGVELSAGSLGHGLPVACGIALAAKRKHKGFKTYVIVGDGEMDEGSNWEALLFGAHEKLNNLCLIIDYNKLQALGYTNEILNLEPLKSKLQAFNWNVLDIDGHNHEQIRDAFSNFLSEETKPTAIIANTVKGKGVSFMENELFWHYHSPNEEEYLKAMEELNK